MTGHVPRHDGWKVRTEDSFARQAVMETLGASIAALAGCPISQ